MSCKDWRNHDADVGNRHVCSWVGDNADSRNATDFLEHATTSKWLSDDTWNHGNRPDGYFDKCDFCSHTEQKKVACCYYGSEHTIT